MEEDGYDNRVPGSDTRREWGTSEVLEETDAWGNGAVINRTWKVVRKMKDAFKENVMSFFF